MRIFLFSVLFLLAAVLAHPQRDRGKLTNETIQDDTDKFEADESSGDSESDFMTEQSLIEFTEFTTEVSLDRTTPNEFDDENGTSTTKSDDGTTTIPFENDENVATTVSPLEDLQPRFLESAEEFNETTSPKDSFESTTRPFETIRGTELSAGTEATTKSYHPAAVSPTDPKLSDSDNEIKTAEKFSSYAKGSVVTNQYYFFSAPEDDSEEVQKITIGRPQRSFKVVFIMAPVSNPIENIQISVAPREDKTAVYVLSRDEENVELNIATSPPDTPTPPEVHFLKYKTSEEAHQLEEKIRGEYAVINGKTEEHNENDTPVLEAPTQK